MKKVMFILFLFIPLFLSSQIKLDGYVISENGDTLNGSLIYIQYQTKNRQKYNQRANTDDNGYFSFELEDTCNAKIKIIDFSYKTFSYDVFLTKDTTINIILTFDVEQVTRKPIIYLYPEQEATVDIKLNFNGKIQNTYPKYNNGWKVLANPSGDLINLQDNSKHLYLFWDGINANNYQIADFETGFIVPNDETLDFLDSTLTKIELTDYEKNDFITFWLPEMCKNNYNFVHFIINQECDKIATFDVNPKPDSEVRIYMVFSKINESFEIPAQKIQTVDRSGFVMVEWGGFEITNKKLSN